MPDSVFIDSNLWIYSFVEAEEEQERRRIVIALLEELSQQSDIITSIFSYTNSPYRTRTYRPINIAI
jgi:predicted nucleic acid-binding protein